ncbi:hypothetical protein ACCS67_34935, partial [Rhizobium brockwellii]|uniref:hypothetical protein n=1 Tax=Rhizobium brockwellii TaxID=3019932 RepID=UPI003F9B7D0B
LPLGKTQKNPKQQPPHDHRNYQSQPVYPKTRRKVTPIEKTHSTNNKNEKPTLRKKFKQQFLKKRCTPKHKKTGGGGGGGG